ncbi:hypothetical protein AYL99_03418 [Fonsecaea erecta]|uniref:CAMK protein kinase n=1 Tax=Fonsecaea erecta TaxID=1367422 RepID=A0A178ZN49_9EURO|nr:hypothetical protein AYL99_03418 [Fonsecaea erecta]OAP61217.1 hypothetical protein AYL99_03418 [Fonsecaea erecta]
MSTFPSSGVHRIGSTLGSVSRPTPAGVLIHKDQKGKVLGRKKIYPNHEIVIGRDTGRCEYVLNDPYVSKRHLRIYTVVYENDESCEIDTLVYAEDLSQNGTFWNGSLMGKGNGGFLLSDSDVLRLSRQTYLTFAAIVGGATKGIFDHTQETEMRKFRKDYVLTDRLLGAGTFGRVFMAVEQTTRRQVACKVVDLRKLGPRSLSHFGRREEPAPADEVDTIAQKHKIKAWAKQQKRENTLKRKLCAYYREVEILSSISHPNIVGVEKVYITDNTIYIMQDLITGGDLFSYIELKNGKLLEVEAAVIVRQVLVAVRFLHTNNIVHRDIKPDNVLMTSLAAGCRVVLTDFGAARRIEGRLHRMSSIIGTREYAAPEILGFARSNLEREAPGYTRAVDMWAVGCISVVLLTGGLAFCDPVTNTYSERLARECNLRFLRESKEWQAVRPRPKEFVEQLLLLDEDARLTAEEALAHSWFSNGAYKNDFEDLYQRTIRHWQPRTLKSRVVWFQDGGSMKNLLCSLGVRDPTGRSHSRSYSPVEPPYKPFPKNMHYRIWPKGNPNKRLSPEVLSAIEKWSPRSAELISEQWVRSSSRAGGPRSKSTDTATTENPRAGSEPSQNRLPFQAPQIPANVDTRNAKKTAFKEHMEDTTTRIDIGELTARAATLKDGEVLLGERSRFSFSATSSSPQGLVRDKLSSSHFPLPANLSVASAKSMQPESPTTPKMLRDVVYHGRTSSIAVESEDEPNINSDITTPPHGRGGLKRRVSTPLFTSQATRNKRPRRESIFELAEDNNSDEHRAKPRVGTGRRSLFDLPASDNDENGSDSIRADGAGSHLQGLSLVHRSKKAAGAAAPAVAAKLYLPR